MGKTNLDQFASGLVGTRSPYGTAPNAFDDRFIPGGSSSGSAAAVGAGLVSFALGTDTAGSGRVPAGYNGCVGVKPTVGKISSVGEVQQRTPGGQAVVCGACTGAWSASAEERVGDEGRWSVELLSAAGQTRDPWVARVGHLECSSGSAVQRILRHTSHPAPHTSANLPAFWLRVHHSTSPPPFPQVWCRPAPPWTASLCSAAAWVMARC